MGTNKKRYKFALNTSGICFLCLENDEKSSENSDIQNNNTNGNKLISIQNILQYLNVDLKQISSLSKSPAFLVNKADFRVSLCKDCESEMDKFTKLCESLELITMKLEYSLETIRGRLKHSGRNEAFTKRYQSSSQNGLNLNNSKIVEELRIEMIKQCTLITPSFQPLLKLQRMTDEEYHSYEKKLKERLRSPPPPMEETDSIAIVKDDVEISYQDQDGDNYQEPMDDVDDSPSVSEPEPIPLNQLDMNIVAATNLQLERTNEVNFVTENPKVEKIKAKPQNRAPVSNKKSIKTVNKANKPEKIKFKCKKCWHTFHDQSYLDLHVMLKHSTNITPPIINKSLKKLQCPICKKIFSKSGLIIHFRTHTGEKSYECQYCKKRFRDKSYLLKHERMHEGNRPHKCKLCSKGFVQLSHLRVHMNSPIHSDMPKGKDGRSSRKFPKRMGDI